LEEALAAFLTSEKTATFLVSVLDKALRLTGDARSADSGAKPQEKYLQQLNRIESRIRALQVRIASGAPPSPAPLIEHPDREAQEKAPEEQPAAVQESDLAKDLRTRGCATCNHMVQSLIEFLSRWQYALASNPNAQATFAEQLGFCPLHTWQLVSIASPQGLSIGLPALLDHIVEMLLRQAETPTPASDATSSPLPANRDCRVCQMLREVERDYTHRMIDYLLSKQGTRAYHESQGLCLRHLSLITAEATPDLSAFLLKEAARRLEQTAEDMQSYAMKHDALRRSLQNQDEEDAYLRAVVHLVGEKVISAPLPSDREI
jgi:hypothetical protein